MLYQVELVRLVSLSTNHKGGEDGCGFDFRWPEPSLVYPVSAMGEIGSINVQAARPSLAQAFVTVSGKGRRQNSRQLSES